jgi:hypothetical protein
MFGILPSFDLSMRDYSTSVFPSAGAMALAGKLFKNRSGEQRLKRVAVGESSYTPFGVCEREHFSYRLRSSCFYLVSSLLRLFQDSFALKRFLVGLAPVMETITGVRHHRRPLRLQPQPHHRSLQRRPLQRQVRPQLRLLLHRLHRRHRTTARQRWQQVETLFRL